MNRAADQFATAPMADSSITLDEVSDESLVAAVRAGDQTAFEQIFERHKLRVTRISGRFFNRPEKVEELVQEVFTKTYFALDDYSKERGSSFAAWISRIAINACYDELRRLRRRPEAAISSITEDETLFLNARLGDTSTASNAEATAISRDLAGKLLARLQPDDRLVLTLLEAENLPVADIAASLGWSISKVKVRAHRARAALRRVLNEFV